MTSTAQQEDSFRAYVGQLSRCEPLDRETELEIARRWVDKRDPGDARLLVSANLRFVVKIANSYRSYGLRVADLVEEGNLGLMVAVQRFEPERGLRFMTYAAYWVRAYILSHILKQRTLVGVGTGPLQSKLFFRLARERARLVGTFGEGVDVDERLARSFGTTVSRVQEMTGRLSGRDVSLDAPISEDGGLRGIDLLPDDGIGIEERCARAERDELVRARLAAMLPGLSSRERYIVDHRLLADDEQTLADIGRHLGLSRERVRQIEERLKRKLKAELADLRDEAAQRQAA